MTNTKEEIRSVIDQIKMLGGKQIKFIILYGSFAEGNQTPLSDIDIAVYYEGSKEKRFRFRKQILGRVNDKFDIQTFQDLPLYIRKEIISHGEVIYQKNYSEIIDIFLCTIREFGDFKPRLDIYYAGLGV